MIQSVQLSTRPQRSRRSRRPRGAVLPVALVCLLIVMSLVGSMLQGAVRARRQLHAQRDLRQTQLLLQAGVDRAAARLRRDAQYTGETWDIPAKEILHHGDGQVVIGIESANGVRKQIRVAAEYPRGSELSVRRSHSFVIEREPTQRKE